MATLATNLASPAGERLSPLVRRVLAPNPGPFTNTGTQTYLVGLDTLAVIDPGPDDPRHVEAILRLAGDTRITHILVTHTHRDHSPAAEALQQATGAIIAGPPQIPGVEWLSDGYDRSYAPDLLLADGDRLEIDGWTLSVVATPGHTSNHLCFALEEEAALFTGDHVMGWSTSVISPPDGSVAAYMASLAKLTDRADRIYYPAHGEPVREPQRLVRGFIAHRRAREAQILRRLKEDGPATLEELAASLYPSLKPALRGAAGRSTLAHLIDLEERGRARLIDRRWTVMP